MPRKFLENPAACVGATVTKKLDENCVNLSPESLEKGTLLNLFV